MSSLFLGDCDDEFIDKWSTEDASMCVASPGSGPAVLTSEGPTCSPGKSFTNMLLLTILPGSAPDHVSFPWPDEVAALRDHFMQLREQGKQPGDETTVDPTHPDPLKRYPRLMMMHRWDKAALEFLLDPRLRDVLTALLRREPLAVQTMLYFKPAGARGQALHQDNYYLRVQPGTCVAAWLALDDCDEANGCLQVVPGTQDWPVLCSIPADSTQSFTDVTVPVPANMSATPMLMHAGDVLFFNGSLVHGSFPNTTADRFRRSLIGHYIEGNVDQVGFWYHPVLRFDGSRADLGTSAGSIPCGIWVEENGQMQIELSGIEVVDGETHE